MTAAPGEGPLVSGRSGSGEASPGPLETFQNIESENSRLGTFEQTRLVSNWIRPRGSWNVRRGPACLASPKAQGPPFYFGLIVR